VEVDAQRAAGRHRVARVDRQVEDREFDLVGIDKRRCQAGVRGDLETDCGPDRLMQQFFDAGHQAAEID